MVDLPLLGRLNDLDTLRTRAPVRLLTLHGPPGVGKSATARELTRRVVDLYPGGVFTVNAPRVLEARGLMSLCTTPVVEGGGRALVFVDDADAAVPVLRRKLGRWLEQAPAVDVLLATREVLGTAEEATFDVRPLPSADAERLAIVAGRGTIREDEAKALAREGAGLPLWILERVLREDGGALGRGFEQRCLEAIESLPASVRLLLEVVATFAGSFSLDLVTRVLMRVATDDPAMLHGRMADGLQRLVDGSLVHPFEARTPERRLRMLAPIRAIVTAHVREPSRSADVARARNRVLHELASSFDLVWGFYDARERARAEVERENFRQMLETGEPDEVASAALVLDALETAGAAPHERAALLDEAATRARSAERRRRAALDLARARVRLFLFETEVAARILDPLRQDPTLRDDGPCKAAVMLSQALVCIHRLDADGARALYASAPTAAGDDARSRARAVMQGAQQLGYLSPPDAALLAATREAVAVLDAIGDEYGAARARVYLGELVVDAGDAEEAVALLEDSVDSFRSLGDPAGEALARYFLARARHASGDLVRARSEYTQLLSEASLRLNPRGEALALTNGLFVELELGDVASARHMAARAVTAALAFNDRRLAAIAVAAGRLIAALESREVDGDDAELLWEPATETERLATEILMEAAAVVPFDDESSQRAFFATLEARHPELLTLRAARSDIRMILRVLELSLCRKREERVRAPAMPRLALTHDGATVLVEGRSIDLASRALLRRILVHLASTARRSSTVAQLVKAGWPDEIVSAHAGAQRVHAAIRRLRDAGLEDVLRSDREGYWVHAHVEWIEPPEIPAGAR
jgi:tetratricopeptide (TPR) repeat protein